MKLKTTFNEHVCKLTFANSWFKKTAMAVFLFCCMIHSANAQFHEDTTVVLDKNAFAVSIDHTFDGLLKFELINNQNFEITPFFIETYVKGYNLSETHIEQSLNDIIFTENIERVFGPQFMGLGINSLPAFGIYKTTFSTESKTSEPSTIKIRISGTMNGQNVIWYGAYNF